jgi:hypothetical protein
MPANELFNRLLQLERRASEWAETHPPRFFDTSYLTSAEQQRLQHFLLLRIDGLTRKQADRLYALLDKCPIFDIREDAECGEATKARRRSREDIERAFVVVFHEFAAQHPVINLPDTNLLLNEVRMDIGIRRFARYGWKPGDRDSSTIMPLDKWAAHDRKMLISLYDDRAMFWIGPRIRN